MDQQPSNFDHYCNVLRPLFTVGDVDPLEHVCAILRVGGLEDEGWDTLEESFETLRDISLLAQIELPSEQFSDIEKTRLRLHLVSYAHVVECDAPYDILANLCRVRAGQNASILPFWDESEYQRRQRKAEKNPGKLLDEPRPPSPSTKIRLIKELAQRGGVLQIGEVFDDFYFPVIRNSINHSDYIIHGNEFRMRKGRLLTDDATPFESPVIPIERLRSIIDRTFAFYSAFFTIHKETRSSFSTLKGKAIPYDLLLKGLLEFLLDDAGLLCGWIVHWPNGMESSFRRTSDGPQPLNIRAQIDDPIALFVGEYHEDHEPFSKLVARGEQPVYTPLEGSTEPLRWPVEQPAEPTETDRSKPTG